MKIVITAGGTSEYIDMVRKITNSGTGKLGAKIADAIASKIVADEIFYIHTPKAVMPHTSLALQNGVKIHDIEIVNTNDLKNAVENVLTNNKIDWFIHSMAVSDYYVASVTTAINLASDINGSDDVENTIKNPTTVLDNSNKLSSSEDNLVVVLKQTPKVIGLIKKLSPETHLVGFKLLDGVSEEELINVATRLMNKNNCEYVLANDLENIRNGHHKALLLNNAGGIERIEGKDDIAKAIVGIIH